MHIRQKFAFQMVKGLENAVGRRRRHPKSAVWRNCAVRNSWNGARKAPYLRQRIGPPHSIGLISMPEVEMSGTRQQSDILSFDWQSLPVTSLLGGDRPAFDRVILAASHHGLAVGRKDQGPHFVQMAF